MPLYLSMTSPETLLRRRRLDEWKVIAADDSDRHQRSRRYPAAGGAAGEALTSNRRRSGALLVHRRPNLSQQSLRYEEAQRKRWSVEKFKHPHVDFDKTLPMQGYRYTKTEATCNDVRPIIGAKTQLRVKSIVCSGDGLHSFPPVPRDCCVRRRSRSDCVESMASRQPKCRQFGRQSNE